MKNLLSHRVLSIEESQTLAMSKLSRKLSEEGNDIINLSIGEPDFNTPFHIKEAAKKAVDDNFTHYTPVVGLLSLRKAISEKLKRENNLDYSFDQIMVSVGAKQTIANIAIALLNPKDEVLLPAPYWVSYRAIIEINGAVVVPVETQVENDFKVDVLDLEKKVTPRTKFLLYSSPSNPTGSVYTIKDLKEIAGFLRRHPNIMVISDEIYELINYTDFHSSIADFEEIKDQVILVNGVSKGFAMTGWRIGYMAAPRWVIEACDKIQGQFTSGACAISQKAAEKALTSSIIASIEMKNKFLERRDVMFDLLRKIKGVKVSKPQGAFFMFPDISYYFNKSFGKYEIKNSLDLVYYLLYHSHVAVVDGQSFGNSNCIRLSYATDLKTIKRAMIRISEALEKLK